MLFHHAVGLSEPHPLSLGTRSRIVHHEFGVSGAAFAPILAALAPSPQPLPMNRPIAGPAPLQVAEVTSATVWPTIGATPLGRLVGKMAGNRTGMGFFTLGKVLAILAIPAALAAYAWKVLPPGVRRYRLTNRRIVIQKGLRPRDDLSVGLGEFDAINVVVLPGQEFLRRRVGFPPRWQRSLSALRCPKPARPPRGVHRGTDGLHGGPRGARSAKRQGIRGSAGWSGVTRKTRHTLRLKPRRRVDRNDLLLGSVRRR